MFFGLLIFKFFPMYLSGREILFDASMHIVVASFILYVLWFFIDQNKTWTTPYFIFCSAVLLIIGVQRILINAHSDVGILLGLIISIISVGISRWRTIRGKISF